MYVIQDILVSDEILHEQFVCNLSACKGACCWEGDLGAPLEEAELPILEAIYEKVKPFLTDAGIAAIEAQGKFVKVKKSFATPLVDDKPCAYMTYNDLGIAQCGIEQANKAGVIDFKKPISCHLYPIRISKNKALQFEAMNYERWDICEPACTLGKQLKVPVYLFLKEPIIRKYGKEFYEELEAFANYKQQL
ncbi:MAG: DUF3109 family protein [Saprospiraceae bacterium]|nr:DUF3109 family protein [Saprospiraceae bacterium]